ncbi:UNVERIFIED_CONTAM: hypothetical protein FKN15_033275 [Acipenser sinensis]
MFRGGRTDTIRSATNEALRFVEVMEDPQAGAEMKLALLKEAIEAHSTYTEQALQGQAIDRHLLGLKLQAIEEGLSMPEIFMDTSYAMATHWKLHTGQVSARTDCVMCFGPMVPDGYAVCYNPLPEHINFSVSAFNCCAETNADKLAGSLKQALRDLQELALQGQAIDRHLLGLKLQAIEEGLSMPEIFMDTSYAMATHWKLHTGQVSARTDCVMCFGPMVPDGYAVCYNPLPEHINFSVSAFNCCAETNADKLARSLKQALRDLQELVLPRED